MSEFAGTLRERIIVERPVAARTASGLQQPGWEPVARCLAAIMPDGVGPMSEAQAPSSMPRFRIAIRRRGDVMVGQRIKWGERRMLVTQRMDDPRTPDRILLRCEEMR